MNKLIILYGFAASGKTTLTKLYIEKHPLTIGVEGDKIIEMIGDWRNHEKTARDLVLQHTISIAENHLNAGHDVLLPYLLNYNEDVEVFKALANRCDADLYQVYLDIEKNDAVDRLITRGCWGEEGSETLTEEDRESLLERFDYMDNVMKQVKNVTSINSELGKITQTYNELIRTLIK